MVIWKRSVWQPGCLARSGLFQPLLHLADRLEDHRQSWPGLSDYQAWLDASVGPVFSGRGAAVRFVPQGSKPARPEDGYEPRIYLKGEVQTRSENWHDFFQVLVWCTFPRSKVTLNTRHYEAITRRITASLPHSQRSSVENLLTQFDECGAVVIASDITLLELIRAFRWKELFWHRREEVRRHLRCVIFGHALYEKALTPYAGMTAHCVLFAVDKAFIASSWRNQLESIDKKLSALFSDPSAVRSPRDLDPFPLLGYPGLVPENDREDYYDNVSYFRPGRGRLKRGEARKRKSASE